MSDQQEETATPYSWMQKPLQSVNAIEKKFREVEQRHEKLQEFIISKQGEGPLITDYVLLMTTVAAGNYISTLVPNEVNTMFETNWAKGVVAFMLVLLTVLWNTPKLQIVEVLVVSVGVFLWLGALRTSSFIQYLIVILCLFLVVIAARLRQEKEDKATHEKSKCQAAIATGYADYQAAFIGLAALFTSVFWIKNTFFR